MKEMEVIEDALKYYLDNDHISKDKFYECMKYLYELYHVMDLFENG